MSRSSPSVIASCLKFKGFKVVHTSQKFLHSRHIFDEINTIACLVVRTLEDRLRVKGKFSFPHSFPLIVLFWLIFHFAFCKYFNEQFFGINHHWLPLHLTVSHDPHSVFHFTSEEEDEVQRGQGDPVGFGRLGVAVRAFASCLTALLRHHSGEAAFPPHHPTALSLTVS